VLIKRRRAAPWEGEFGEAGWQFVSQEIVLRNGYSHPQQFEGFWQLEGRQS